MRPRFLVQGGIGLQELFLLASSFTLRIQAFVIDGSFDTKNTSLRQCMCVCASWVLEDHMGGHISHLFLQNKSVVRAMGFENSKSVVVIAPWLSHRHARYPTATTGYP